MKIVGLTGGIGSGKTTVSKCFEKLGIPVFYADTVAKNLYNSPEVIAQVKLILGVDVIHDESGNLNRSLIAGLIFNDPVKLKQVNALLHPLVKDEFYKWIKAQDAPYCIREAAILIESGSYVDCDSIIVVVADLQTRIKRVMHRDQTSETEVKERIVKQLSDEERMKYANFVIQNNGGIEELEKQVNQIHSSLV